MAVVICIAVTWVFLSVFLAFVLGSGLRRAEVLNSPRSLNERRPVSSLRTRDRFAAAG